MINKVLLVLILLLGLVLAYLAFNADKSESSGSSVITKDQGNVDKSTYAIVIHGGAGTILKKNMTDEREKEYLDMLNKVLDHGEGILKSGGKAIDAVEQAIWLMEDSPLFNAGKGAVYTHDAKNELDASIMSGLDQNAGSIGGVTNVRHPISAARAVLEQSDHVLLTSKGAEQFAKEKGLEIVDPSYFRTERRWNSLQRILEEEKNNEKTLSELSENKHGTVGYINGWYDK